MSSTTDKVKGKANEMAGKVRKAAGDAMNDPEMEADGAAQEGKGKCSRRKATRKMPSRRSLTVPRPAKCQWPAHLGPAPYAVDASRTYAVDASRSSRGPR